MLTYCRKKKVGFARKQQENHSLNQLAEISLAGLWLNNQLPWTSLLYWTKGPVYGDWFQWNNVAGVENTLAHFIPMFYFYFRKWSVFGVTLVKSQENNVNWIMDQTAVQRRCWTIVPEKSHFRSASGVLWLIASEMKSNNSKKCSNIFVGPTQGQHGAATSCYAACKNFQKKKCMMQQSVSGGQFTNRSQFSHPQRK